MISLETNDEACASQPVRASSAWVASAQPQTPLGRRSIDSAPQRGQALLACSETSRHSWLQLPHCSQVWVDGGDVSRTEALFGVIGSL